MPELAKAVRHGLVDGFRQPHDLSMGMTWEDPKLNEAYDRAVNYGQWAGRVAEAVRSGPVPNGGDDA